MRFTRSFVATSVAMVLVTASAQGWAKSDKDEDSVHSWGRWGAIFPAAGAPGPARAPQQQSRNLGPGEFENEVKLARIEEPAEDTPPADPAPIIDEPVDSAPEVVAEAPVEVSDPVDPTPEVPVDDTPEVVEPPVGEPEEPVVVISGCTEAAACSYGTVRVIPPRGTPLSDDPDFGALAIVDITMTPDAENDRRPRGTLSFATIADDIDPNYEPNAYPEDLENHEIRVSLREDGSYTGSLEVGDRIYTVTTLPPIDGSDVQLGTWRIEDNAAELQYIGNFVTGTAATLAEMDTLQAELLGVTGNVIADYSGVTVGGDGVAMQVDFGASSWNASFDGATSEIPFDVTNGVVDGVNFVSTEFGAGVVSEQSRVQGSFMAAGRVAAGNFHVVTGAGELSDAFAASLKLPVN